MAIESVAPSSSNATQQTAPARQAEQLKPADRPAERVEQPPPPPPPQAAVAPTVNTSGQRIGTTISTSA